MLTTALTLFAAGLLTILLPCILPLIPIVLGVSIAGRSKWRPLLTVAGMLFSFVGFTFLLQVVLSSFIELADTIRIATYYVLLLFGICFLTHNRIAQIAVAVLGSFFFVSKGWVAVPVAAVLGILAIEIGGRVATFIQQLGTDVQSKTRENLGGDSPLTAFIVGMTMGMVWVPCAGPALGFAFSLVREQPGFQALLLLFAYGLGTALPLLAIGYGGQAAVHSVRALSRYSGQVKQVAGGLLLLSAIAFQFNVFTALQTWLVNNTSFGTLGTDLEEALFGDEIGAPLAAEQERGIGERLPDLGPAPAEFPGLGPWHNSEPLTAEDLKGKVVLVDFWTYSCINCIRTLPYIQGYWEKYEDAPFVLLGVHSPEFVFEKSEANVKDAIARHGLTYPVAQDNDFLTWRSFSNRYWPAKYLIDAEGRIRYRHFGEGAYDETDRAIASLLAEIGVSASGSTASVAVRGERMPVTPETYLGERTWQALANAEGGPDAAVHDYVLPDTLPLHSYALDGEWQMADDERQVLRSNAGVIRIRALAGEVNLVLGLEEGAKPSAATVLVDGKETSTFTVDRDDLYVLYKGDYGEHDIVLKLSGPGVAGYAYTFGQ